MFNNGNSIARSITIITTEKERERSSRQFMHIVTWVSVAILSVSVSYSFDQGDKQSVRTHSYLYITCMYGCYFTFDTTIVRCVHATKSGDTTTSCVLEFKRSIRDRKHSILISDRIFEEREKMMLTLKVPVYYVITHHSEVPMAALLVWNIDYAINFNFNYFI